MRPLRPHGRANPAIEILPPTKQRRLIEQEAKRRKTGSWPAWEKVELPTGIPGGGGWCRDVRAAWRNGVFAVLVRPLPGVTHMMITSLSKIRPTWWEAQRIKNEIAGEAATAVEVYPPQPEVVDDADAYHLWVLPEGLPFSLKKHG